MNIHKNTLKNLLKNSKQFTDKRTDDNSLIKAPTSAYMVVIKRNNKPIEKTTLADYRLLGRDRDQLKFAMYLDTKNSNNNQIVVNTRQFIFSIVIDSPHVFYPFLDAYVSGPELDQKPYVTKALFKQFYVSTDKAEAEKICNDLKHKQAVYYSSLVENAKTNTELQDLVVIDLYQYLAKFVLTNALPDLMNEQDFVKRFQVADSILKRKINVDNAETKGQDSNN